jgi:hypothetical protein
MSEPLEHALECSTCPVKLVHDGPGRHCQTNLTGPAKGADLKRSGCKLTPLNQGGSAVLFEDVAGVEVAAEVEVVVD